MPKRVTQRRGVPVDPNGRTTEGDRRPPDLFGMLQTGEPEPRRTVLAAFDIDGAVLWMVGIVIESGADLWFRQDGSHQIFAVRVSLLPCDLRGWMYLPNADVDAPAHD